MQLYREILRITEEIESSLRNDSLELLDSLQEQREEMFSQLPLDIMPEEPEKVARLIRLIRSIRSAESRCQKLAKVKKERIAAEMGQTGSAKKLHNAYGHHALI